MHATDVTSADCGGARIGETRLRVPLEAIGWLIVCLVAGGLRLASLGSVPLSAKEAHEALAATSATQGVEPAAPYSPLLLVANGIVIWLFGATDATVRIVPALAGTVLAATPFCLRERIGRTAALVASVLLALSPGLIAASRQCDGTTVACLGLMMLLVGVLRFEVDWQRRWLVLMSLGFVLSVASSASSYSFLLGLILSVLVMLTNPAICARLGRVVSQLASARAWLVLVSGALFFLLSTGCGWNYAAIGAAGDLAANWLARFGAGPSSEASSLLVLTVYETLVVMLGIHGGVQTIRRSNRFDEWLSAWSLIAVCVAVVLPGFRPLEATGIVLPLALLAGRAVQRLTRPEIVGGAARSEGIYGLVVGVVWMHCLLVLARYGNPSTVEPGRYLLLAALSTVLQLAMAGTIGALLGMRTALRGLTVGTVALIAALTISTGWRVAFPRRGESAELIGAGPMAASVRDLVGAVEEISWQQTGTRSEIRLRIIDGADGALAWYFRDFSQATFLSQEELAESELGELPLVASPGLQLEGEESGALVGHGFPLRRNWEFQELLPDCEWPPDLRALVSWLLFRRLPDDAVGVDVITLWIPARLVVR